MAASTWSRQSRYSRARNQCSSTNRSPASYDDAREIAKLARAAGVPWFSSSSPPVRAIRGKPESGGRARRVCVGSWPDGRTPHDAAYVVWHPCGGTSLHDPRSGCESVSMTSENDADVVVGKWKDGRIGTVRAMRPYGPFGGVVFHGKQQVLQSDPKNLQRWITSPCWRRSSSFSGLASLRCRKPRRLKCSHSWMLRNGARTLADPLPSYGKHPRDL